MREIKFRGKSIENKNIGEWVVGDLHLLSPYAHIHTEIGTKCKIDPNTVGQFTGYHDLNDKRIYEGDIVKFTAHDAFGNELGNQQGVVKFKFGSYLIGGYNMYDILLNDDEAEVIGNTHDNPELLKSL